MFQSIRHLLEMIRFSHTLFALPFALLAALMALFLRSLDELSYHDILDARGSFAASILPGFTIMKTSFHWQQLVGILLCMVTARSAAMAFNRLADRTIDADNPRTATRHIPAGLLQTSTVWAFAILCSIGFVSATLLFLPNRLPLYLSLPVLLFLLSYSYAKRFTALAHFWLGAALMLAPICAWIAIRGETVLHNPLDLLPAVVLGGAVLLWVAGFDMIYACQDVDFDRQQGLHSVPAKLGVRNSLRLAAVCHLGTVVLLSLLPLVYAYFGWLYWSGVAAVAALLLYEHWLVRPDDLSRVNVAFFNVNAVIGLGLFAVGALELLWFN